MNIWRFGRSLAPCALAFAAAINPVSSADCQFISEPAQITAPISLGDVHQQPVAKMAFAEWRRQQLAGKAVVETAQIIQNEVSGQTALALRYG